MTAEAARARHRFAASVIALHEKNERRLGIAAREYHTVRRSLASLSGQQTPRQPIAETGHRVHDIHRLAARDFVRDQCTERLAAIRLYPANDRRSHGTFREV